ncbi:hypothetical protein [Streptomyces roseoverticillatus]|uniref:Uncharacterized protein n=1 Tax=Streptomyces roseoverticillatus TaxID=66429 RepID=A0ABV3J6S9_9ACTN
MTGIDNDTLDDLSRLWDDIRENHQDSRNSGYDQAVLDCAARLAADPGGGTAFFWTLGLAMTAPYVARLPGEGVRQGVVAALEAADGALRDRPCDHGSHPYRDHDHHDDLYLGDQLVQIADETAEWDEERPRDEWLCPRNTAGFARIALDIIAPGSVTDVPPRVPVDDRGTIATLSSLLHGYPLGIDIDEEISFQARSLTAAEPEDRAGRLQVVRAVSWYAVSGMVRTKSVLDDLVEAVEQALPHFEDATCAHERHPVLPGSGPDAAELGVMLSSPGGRGVYERICAEEGYGAPLEKVVCPVLMEEVAEDVLDRLRERREELFGNRDTSHADAEYLRADGRLEIERIADRLDYSSRNEQYADDLGLWAARRYERAGERERAVLLLTVYQTMKISYPSPPLPVVRGVLATLRAVAAAPRPDACAHDDEHPALRYAEFRRGMPHFYAPEEFPPAEECRSAEAWTCPRFAAAVAEECVEGLAGLYEDDGGGEE